MKNEEDKWHKLNLHKTVVFPVYFVYIKKKYF